MTITNFWSLAPGLSDKILVFWPRKVLHTIPIHQNERNEGGGPTPNMLEFAIWGWGKMGKSGEKWGKLKLIIHLNCLELSTFVYSKLKISTGDAIWAYFYIFSYSITSLTEIFFKSILSQTATPTKALVVFERRRQRPAYCQA